MAFCLDTDFHNFLAVLSFGLHEVLLDDNLWFLAGYSNATGSIYYRFSPLMCLYETVWAVILIFKAWTDPEFPPPEIDLHATDLALIAEQHDGNNEQHNRDVEQHDENEERHAKDGEQHNETEDQRKEPEEHHSGNEEQHIKTEDQNDGTRVYSKWMLAISRALLIVACAQGIYLVSLSFSLSDYRWTKAWLILYLAHFIAYRLLLLSLPRASSGTLAKATLARAVTQYDTRWISAVYYMISVGMLAVLWGVSLLQVFYVALFMIVCMTFVWATTPSDGGMNPNGEPRPGYVMVTISNGGISNGGMNMFFNFMYFAGIPALMLFSIFGIEVPAQPLQICGFIASTMTSLWPIMFAAMPPEGLRLAKVFLGVHISLYGFPIGLLLLISVMDAGSSTNGS